MSTWVCQDGCPWAHAGVTGLPGIRAGLAAHIIHTRSMRRSSSGRLPWRMGRNRGRPFSCRRYWSKTIQGRTICWLPRVAGVHAPLCMMSGCPCSWQRNHRGFAGRSCQAELARRNRLNVPCKGIDQSVSQIDNRAVACSPSRLYCIRLDGVTTRVKGSGCMPAMAPDLPAPAGRAHTLQGWRR